MVLLADTERIGAQTALRISLVTEVTPLDTLWTRAHELAALIAQRHPVAVQGSIRAIWEAQSLPRAQAGDKRAALHTNRQAVGYGPPLRPTSKARAGRFDERCAERQPATERAVRVSIREQFR